MGGVNWGSICSTLPFNNRSDRLQAGSGPSTVATLGHVEFAIRAKHEAVAQMVFGDEAGQRRSPEHQPQKSTLQRQFRDFA